MNIKQEAKKWKDGKTIVKKQFNTRLSPATIQALKELQHHLGLNQADTVEFCIQNSLQHVKSEKGES